MGSAVVDVIERLESVDCFLEGDRFTAGPLIDV